jgi:hypothetical protein
MRQKLFNYNYTFYRQCPMFVHNSFLKNCTKVEQQTYNASVYIKVLIYGQQTKQL